MTSDNFVKNNERIWKKKKMWKKTRWYDWFKPGKIFMSFECIEINKVLTAVHDNSIRSQMVIIDVVF